MAYVRHRTTKAGTLSTALVESYRDEHGRPRQRLLANLHGETSTLKALAKLAACRDVLRNEKKSLMAERPDADTFYEAVTQSSLQGRRYSDAERKEIDLRQRELLLKRLAKIEHDLATIQKDGAIIKKHCTATSNEIQTAIRAHKQEHRDAEALVLGMTFGHAEQIRKAKAALRRLSI